MERPAQSVAAVAMSCHWRREYLQGKTWDSEAGSRVLNLFPGCG